MISVISIDLIAASAFSRTQAGLFDFDGILTFFPRDNHNSYRDNADSPCDNNDSHRYSHNFHCDNHNSHPDNNNFPRNNHNSPPIVLMITRMFYYPILVFC